jgi:hypothetical protein
MPQNKQLSDEDMARVKEFLSTGYNDTERKPFRPLYMMVLLVAAVSSLSVLSLVIARSHGI